MIIIRCFTGKIKLFLHDILKVIFKQRSEYMHKTVILIQMHFILFCALNIFCVFFLCVWLIYLYIYNGTSVDINQHSGDIPSQWTVEQTPFNIQCLATLNVLVNSILCSPPEQTCMWGLRFRSRVRVYKSVYICFPAQHLSHKI